MDLVKFDLILPFSMLKYILLVPFNERRDIPPSSVLFKSRYTASAMNKGNQEFPGLRFLRILCWGEAGGGDIFSSSVQGELSLLLSDSLPLPQFLFFLFLDCGKSPYGTYKSFLGTSHENEFRQHFLSLLFCSVNFLFIGAKKLPAAPSARKNNRSRNALNYPVYSSLIRAML